ncbi:uncharacterized protein LOC141908222 [Tubulanus polymorphus]|uniref:uncharacterized protein LOC141908222 n=1 Tax=Tubulanus polymorphus TaxID=672921 RepID=UPI003DA63082
MSNRSIHTESIDSDYSSPNTINSVSSSNSTGSTTLVEISIKPVYKQQHNCAEEIRVLPQLPSEKFKYTLWHELCDTDLTGPQLNAPRIREGPINKDKLIDKNDERVENKTVKEKKDYRDVKEDWENCVKGNLSYQELSHEYQRTNFTRVLQRMRHVEELIIVENNLQNISTVTLPQCVSLNVSRNFLGSLTNLPKCPEIRHLNISMNNILTLNGLKRFKGTPLVSLNMKGNPVEFTQNYRIRVFRILPQLKVLDGISRLPEDQAIIDEVTKNRNCLIS